MIRWSIQDGVCELELRREPCNEIGTSMLAELERFVADLEPKGLRAMIVYSGLRRGFCAGADLRELYAAMQERAVNGNSKLPERLRNRAYRALALRKFIDRIHRVMDRLDTLPVPTVGVVHGVCFGGGFELALTCDVLVAERSARFCFPELRLGLIPGFGGIPRLKRELPNPVVRDLLLTGRSMNAKRALELGLVSQMVAPGKGLTVARQVARQLSMFEGGTVASAKAFIKPLPREELRREKELFLRMCQGPTLERALARFAKSTDRMPYLPQGM